MYIQLMVDLKDMIGFSNPKVKAEEALKAEPAKVEEAPRKQSLFAISAELEDIFFEIEEAGGEVTEEILAKLAITEENLKQKLDGYRKYYTSLSLDAEACKKEETRIAMIRKTKENQAKRLKDSMYEAVAAYGETGKNGNKVINLVDSKLYTKKSEVLLMDEELLLTFKDMVFDQFRELYNNDMLDTDNPNVDSLDPQGFIDVINAKFKAERPERAERMMEEHGQLFTIDDLMNLNVKFETSIGAYSLLSKAHFSLINAFFNEEHISNVVPDINKTTLKNILKTGGVSNFAELGYSESLIIK